MDAVMIIILLFIIALYFYFFGYTKGQEHLLKDYNELAKKNDKNVQQNKE